MKGAIFGEGAEGIIFGMPCTTGGGRYEVVKGLDISDAFTKERLAITLKELTEERDAVKPLLG